MCYKEITVFAISHVLLQETALMYLLSVLVQAIQSFLATWNIFIEMLCCTFCNFCCPLGRSLLKKTFLISMSAFTWISKGYMKVSLLKKMIAASTLWPEVVHCCTNWLDIIHKRHVWQIIGQQLIFHSLNTCRRLLAYTVNYFLAQHQLVWIHDLPCTPTSC